jgi:hypothetical protein
VFVSESVSVDVPLAVAQHRLLEFLLRGDMDSLASAAYEEGVTVFTKAGVAGLSKTVEIQSIPAYQRGSSTVVPLRWVATGPLGSAFPVLDANLELSAGDAGTELLIVGSYRPPFGALGAALDRLMLHSVAQATVRRFATQLTAVAAGVPQRAPRREATETGSASDAEPDPVG